MRHAIAHASFSSTIGSMAEDWITSAEGAALSGYHPEHLRRLIREKKVKARKFGIVWQINRKSLLAYLGEAEKSEDKRRGPKIDTLDKV